jgi:hypothetical protein
VAILRQLPRASLSLRFTNSHKRGRVSFTLLNFILPNAPSIAIKQATARQGPIS